MSKTLVLLLCFITYSFGQSLSEKFDLAMNSYNSSQYVQANRLFDGFMKEHTEFDELYAAAEYYSAMSLLKTGNIDASAVRFEYLVKNFVWSSFRDRSE